MRTLIVGFIGAASVWAAGARVGAAAEIPSLAGTWRFNAGESDDAREKMREGRVGPSGGERPRGGPGGPGGVGRGGFGGSGGGGRPGPGMGGPRGDRRGPGGPMMPASELEIVQEAGEVRIAEKEGRTRRFVMDGKSHKSENGLEEVKASWSNEQQLVVESKREDGPKRKESIGLAADGKRLVVKLEFDTPFGSKMKLRHVYDRVETPPAKPGDKPVEAAPPASTGARE